MTVRELEKRIKQVDRHLASDRRVISHYIHYTVIPYFKQLSIFEIAAGTLLIGYLLRHQIKKVLLPTMVATGKKLLTSYLIFQTRFLMH